MKTLAKTLSWTFVSVLIIFVPAYVETASIKSAFVVAFAAVAAKTPFFAVHEAVFERIWPGDRNAEDKRGEERRDGA